MLYQKKPVVIEAVKFDGTDKSVEWLLPQLKNGNMARDTNKLYINTLEGVMTANKGDYIIKGVNGEFYPCKPDIFKKTYEQVKQVSEMEVINRLCTRNSTVVFCEDKEQQQYNAPHHFTVKKIDPIELRPIKEICNVNFQEGPIKEVGINGVHNEDLILMVLTRLEAFQESEYKCRENAIAITKLEEAILWMRARTMDRERRNVLGTSNL